MRELLSYFVIERVNEILGSVKREAMNKGGKVALTFMV